MGLSKNPPIIIDIEASGFGPQSYPIEVGLVLASGQTYCALIQPLPEWDFWDAKAEAVHRIPRDVLELYGQPVLKVAQEINELLKDQHAYSDGWIVDKTWLSTLFYAAKIPQYFSFSMLDLILIEEQMEIWHSTKDGIIRELDLKRHRASYDAIIIQKTYERTRPHKG